MTATAMLAAGYPPVRCRPEHDHEHDHDYDRDHWHDHDSFRDERDDGKPHDPPRFLEASVGTNVSFFNKQAGSDARTWRPANNLFLNLGSTIGSERNRVSMFGDLKLNFQTVEYTDAGSDFNFHAGLGASFALIHSQNTTHLLRFDFEPLAVGMAWGDNTMLSKASEEIGASHGIGYEPTVGLLYMYKPQGLGWALKAKGNISAEGYAVPSIDDEADYSNAVYRYAVKEQAELFYAPFIRADDWYRGLTFFAGHGYNQQYLKVPEFNCDEELSGSMKWHEVIFGIRSNFLDETLKNKNDRRTDFMFNML